MRTNLAAIAGAGAVLLLVHAAPIEAHHSFAAEFDASKVVEFTGVVTKVEWQNPHAFFYIDVVVDEEAGRVENWGWEMGSPNALMRRGWTRNTLRIGDVVRVNGAVSRDGRKVANVRTVVLDATGQRLFAGTSEPGIDNNRD